MKQTKKPTVPLARGTLGEFDDFDQISHKVLVRRGRRVTKAYQDFVRDLIKKLLNPTDLALTLQGHLRILNMF